MIRGYQPTGSAVLGTHKLARQLSERTGLPFIDCRETVRLLVESIRDCLLRDREVQFSGLGKLKLVARRGRTAKRVSRLNKNGRMVQVGYSIPNHWRMKLEAAQKLRDMLRALPPPKDHELPPIPFPFKK